MEHTPHTGAATALVDRARELYEARLVILECLDRRPPEDIIAIAAYIRSMDDWPIEAVESNDGAKAR